jgi:hypothetical protein
MSPSKRLQINLSENTHARFTRLVKRGGMTQAELVQHLLFRNQVLDDFERLVRLMSKGDFVEIEKLITGGRIGALDRFVDSLSETKESSVGFSRLEQMLSEFDPIRHGGEFPPVELPLNSGKKKGSRKTRKP